MLPRSFAASPVSCRILCVPAAALLVLVVALPASALSAQAVDDAGNPITEEEIRARTRSGAGAAVIGGILGAGLGLFLGLGADLSGENLEGRSEAGPLIGLAIGSGAGAFAGARLTRVTREQVIERIRKERRETGRTGWRPMPSILALEVPARVDSAEEQGNRPVSYAVPGAEILQSGGQNDVLRSGLKVRAVVNAP